LGDTGGIGSGTEVFSLLRDSDLEPDDYLRPTIAHYL